MTGGSAAEMPAQSLLFPERSGFRLDRIEVYNWGTFDEKVWTLRAGCDNVLVTGDIGSGKSTLVDALTTLLVAPNKLAYNKAAGAESRERSARSYVLGHYKSERSELGNGAKAVALRAPNQYSVLLAHFRNEGFGQSVCLAQVFWLPDPTGQPERLYVVADRDLSITTDFSQFGSRIEDLRKRLKAAPQVEQFSAFSQYAQHYRRQFGIEHEQAMNLFHQTVSLKSIGNLTEFVRGHMLEAFPVRDRIDQLVAHFDNLHRAHEAVLRAKNQVGLLQPLVANCDAHAALQTEIQSLKECRESLAPWVAGHRVRLLGEYILDLEQKRLETEAEVKRKKAERDDLAAKQDAVKADIRNNGGDRLERLRDELRKLEADKIRCETKSAQYESRAKLVGFPALSDEPAFLRSRERLDGEIHACEDKRDKFNNRESELKADERALEAVIGEIENELRSLRSRRTNIPLNMLTVRANLCRSLRLEAETIPFVGELLRVRPEHQAWEGAAERLLHGFGLSLLVPDAEYARVAEWVDKENTGQRLVYYRVRPLRVGTGPQERPGALSQVLQIHEDTPHYSWLENELFHRFDHQRCENLDEFRRETKAITQSGQVKGKGEHHEKDDRYALSDRSRYVLGWSNEDKIRALEANLDGIEQRRAAKESERLGLVAKRKQVEERAKALQGLVHFDSFAELDWRSRAASIVELERERTQLKASSQILAELQAKLDALRDQHQKVEGALEKLQREASKYEEKLDNARLMHAKAVGGQALASPTAKAMYPKLEQIWTNAGSPLIDLGTIDKVESDLRSRLQSSIDRESARLSRLGEQIVSAMQDYRNAYRVETQETDAKVEAAGEYRRMLASLQADDLPKFEARFKELLNENTIREIANFQMQLQKEVQDIKDRIQRINASLLGIDYNPGRYIRLEEQQSSDAEIREFRQDLKACTEGAMTGSGDDAYSEAKFVQVKAIVERFRGRDGRTDDDARWTKKATDVRQWFSFAASERWREGDAEHEHYSDSAGKSGGQKEKLAYTVLAASLAYQFGLEWAGGRSRSFRFAVIDEAFGRGSDDSARFGLSLFQKLHLQLMIVTPLQKIHIIEPHVAAVAFVHVGPDNRSMVRNLTIDQYRAEREAREK